MEGGLNPNIGLEQLGAGVQPSAAPVQSQPVSTYTPYQPKGGGISPLEAGAQSTWAGMSEASKIYYDYAPPAYILEELGLFNREEAINVLDEEAQKAFSEFKKYKPAVASYKDIDSAGSLIDYVGDNLAMGAPQIAAMFMGVTGLAMLGMEATGSTLLAQEEAGNERDVGRAVVTGALEGVLNAPLSKAAKGIFQSIGKTNLDDVAKRNLTAELIKGIGTDAGVNGLQQVLRNYGVEGVVSAKDLDEAIVGGLIVSAPIRSVNTVATKALKDKVVNKASDTAVKTGDIEKADGLVNKTINFLAGEALRPVRRIKNTQAGSALFEKVENMRINREVMVGTLNNRVTDLFNNVKDQDAFISAYSRGLRDTPQLKELATIMDEVHTRANDVNGANLDIGYIENYLPTLIDPKALDADNVSNIKVDYNNWYIQNKDVLRANAIANGKDPNDVITPHAANKIIDEYVKAINNEEIKPAELPRVRIDNEGNVISASAPIETRSVRREDSLDFTRMLGFIPQEILSQYAVKEAMPEQIKQYIFGAAQRISYAEQMGKNNEKLNVDVANAGNELKAVNKPFNADEINNIYDSMDAYQGLYKQFKDENGRKWASRARVVTNMFALPLTLLSSLTEPLNLAIKIGNVEAAKAFTASLKTISQDLISHFTNGAVPRSEVGKQLLMTDRAFRNATTALNNRLNGEYASSLNKSGLRQLKSMTSWNNAYFHITGQTAMNYLVNSMSAHAANAQVKNDIMIVNGYEGTRIGQEAAARLNAVGIPASQFKTLHKDSKMLSKMMPSVIARFNKDVALNPEALDKPLWMSTGWGQMFSQLKGYPTMFTNTVLPKFIQIFDTRGKSGSEISMDTIRGISTIGMIVSLGFVQESLKNEVKGGTSNDEEVLTKAVRNTLIPIHVGYLMDTLNGEMSRVATPAAVGIADTYIKRVHKGEDIKLEDMPILNSIKGML